jgi:hypothetical protein
MIRLFGKPQKPGLPSCGCDPDPSEPSRRVFRGTPGRDPRRTSLLRSFAVLALGVLLLGLSAAGVLAASGTSSGDVPGGPDKGVAFQPPKKGTWVRILKSRHLLQLYEGRTRIAEFGVAVGSNPGQKQRIGDRRTP